jgi:hypothetical protein
MKGHTMKHIVAILCILTLTIGIASAQDQTAKGKAGDKALLFSLNGLSNLGAGNFQGGLGFRYHFTSSMAGRVALGFGMTSVTDKAPTGSSTAVDEKTTDMSFGVAPGLEYYIVHTNSVNGYIGAEVFFRMTSKTVEGVGNVANTKTEVSESTFGAAALIGAEWFPWTGIGLSAEYHLHFSTTTGTSKSTIGSTTTESDAPTETMIGLGSANSANFTLSIYL